MTDKELFGNSEQLDDPISRRAALNTAEWAYKACEGDLSYYHNLLVAVLMDLTPAQRWIPVVHGHWKEDPSGYGFWICSACGFVSEASAADMLYKFCPVCGAKLDGKDGDHHDTV